MATQWTNPVAPGSPIRAFDIQEVINAINNNRSAAGLEPFPWTDPVVAAEMPIKAVHFTEMRQAIQGLWSSKSMGALPNWSSGVTPGGPSAGTAATIIYASDLTDLRGWLNQYENATRTTNPKRGMHLRDDDHRQEDYWALNEYNPGSVVLLSRQLVDWDSSLNDWVMTVSQKALADWLKARVTHPAGMEVFVRIYPSPQTRPIYSQPFEGHPNNGVVDEIFRVYDKVLAYNGLVISRYLPGNEPNTEWGLNAYLGSTWDTIAAYYTDVYNTTQANKGTRNIELYTPPIAQQNYAEEYNIEGGVPMQLDTGELGGYNRASVKAMIQLYNSFSWHNYFRRNNAWQHRVEQYFPTWLQEHLWVHLAPARITEAGWKPEEGSNRDYDFGSSAYWNDMNYFMRTATQAGGVMVWLVSKLNPVPGENVWKHAAVAKDYSTTDPNYNPDTTGNADGTVIRPWIRKLAIIAPPTP
ncbi:MAG: hypothetical protein M1136_08940 [Chloroflexi bacterium]|nr:hypothetical protein [Chloroflexota bacterium]